jgi:hypothetical protein
MAESFTIQDGVVDTSDHDAQMAEGVVETQHNVPGEAPSAIEGGDPSNLEGDITDPPVYRPDKFKSDEEWRKSYDQLEQKLHGKGTPESSEETTTETTTPTGPINMEALSKEVAETGTLSEASYGVLEKAGIPKAYTDQFMEGQQAIAELRGSAIKNSVGGDETYQAMVEWAKVNYDESQIAAYDTAVNGDVNGATLAAKGLLRDYQDAVGSEGNTISGDSNASGDNDVYNSNAELTEDMKDPRYRKDPAFQKRVGEKLSRSNLFTGNRY